MLNQYFSIDTINTILDEFNNTQILYGYGDNIVSTIKPITKVINITSSNIVLPNSSLGFRKFIIVCNQLPVTDEMKTYINLSYNNIDGIPTKIKFSTVNDFIVLQSTYMGWRVMYSYVYERDK